MTGERSRATQLRLDLEGGGSATVLILTSGAERFSKPQQTGREDLISPVVDEEFLERVIQDLIFSGGEDADRSGFLARLMKEMKEARIRGDEIEDFKQQLRSSLSQARNSLEGATLGTYPRVASIVLSTIGELAEDVWTNPTIS